MATPFKLMSIDVETAAVRVAVGHIERFNEEAEERLVEFGSRKSFGILRDLLVEVYAALRAKMILAII